MPKFYDANSLTKADVKDMIANGDDTHDNQIRVTKSGLVFLSQDIIGADHIDNLAFRLESFDAGNDYVGINAANDNNYIEKIYFAIKYHWNAKSRETYIDDWMVVDYENKVY